MIFVTALWMRRNPEGLKLLLAHPDLFSLQNHGERHIPPVLGDRTIFGIRTAGDLATIRTDVTNGAHAIKDASGIEPRWYRAATGFYTPSVIPEIEAMGFAIGGYSFSADAGASLSAERVTARLTAAKGGDVIIAHINQPLRPSGAGVAAGLLELQRQGVTFARLDQLAETAAKSYLGRPPEPHAQKCQQVGQRTSELNLHGNIIRDNPHSRLPQEDDVGGSIRRSRWTPPQRARPGRMRRAQLLDCMPLHRRLHCRKTSCHGDRPAGSFSSNVGFNQRKG